MMSFGGVEILLAKMKGCLVETSCSFRREFGRTPPSSVYWLGCANQPLRNDSKDGPLSLHYDN